MDHVRWHVDPDTVALHRPVVIAAFTGWNDAGDAASCTLRTLIDATGASPLAEVDPEEFTDFATVRPQVRLDEQRRRSISWPTVGIWSAAMPGADALLILGPEPALRWRLFSDQITHIAQRFDATLAITIGALLADVPHTRPTQVIGTGTDANLIDRYDLQQSNYEGPTGIVGVLHDALSRQGIPTASLWAAVPGYASQIPTPSATLALLERTCAMIGTPVPVTDLPRQALDWNAKVDALVADDDDLVRYVARLESMADEYSFDESIDDIAEISDSVDRDDGNVPNGFGDTDDYNNTFNDNFDRDSETLAGFAEAVDNTDPEGLAAEVERFLREQRDS